MWRSDANGKMCPASVSVAVFPMELIVEELGRPGSPHGAELMQRLAFT